MAAPDHRNIVIIGGGIIGCTTAYYLSRHPSVTSVPTKITVLESSAHGVAQGASGKAGGLVAKWAYPKDLVNISFPEHVKLAEEHDGATRWGWRFVGCGSWEGAGVLASEEESGTGVGKGGRRKSLEKKLGLENGDSNDAAAKGGQDTTRLPPDLDWVVREQTTYYSPMAPKGHTAQVHPYLFTTSMMDLAKEQGTELVQGSAKEIVCDGGRVSSVVYQTKDAEQHMIPATHVVLAAGAWSPTITPLESLPISAMRAHSITIRPKPSVTITPYVLFTEINLPATSGSRSRTVSPEIYARPDNEVYACGPGDDSFLPGNVGDVEVDQAACESIREHVASISHELREGDVERRQACFLPGIAGGPIVGAADKIANGMYIATGHTCWGICNAPGTAKALAELILEGKIKSGNLKKLSPSNFL